MPSPVAGRCAVWQRFTPAERLARFSVYLAIVFAVAWAAQSVEVIPEFL